MFFCFPSTCGDLCFYRWRHIRCSPLLSALSSLWEQRTINSLTRVHYSPVGEAIWCSFVLKARAAIFASIADVNSNIHHFNSALFSVWEQSAISRISRFAVHPWAMRNDALARTDIVVSLRDITSDAHPLSLALSSLGEESAVWQGFTASLWMLQCNAFLFSQHGSTGGHRYFYGWRHFRSRPILALRTKRSLTRVNYFPVADAMLCCFPSTGGHLYSYPWRHFRCAPCPSFTIRAHTGTDLCIFLERRKYSLDAIPFFFSRANHINPVINPARD